MARRNDNARPRPEIGPLDTAVSVADRPETVSVPFPVGHRDHAARTAAKHTPSRVTSRMYAQLHAVTQVLDDAAAHLARVALPSAEHDEVTDLLRAHRARLATNRDAIADAGHDHEVADAVKDDMGRLESSARLLDPAIGALTYSTRALAAAAAATDVPEALAAAVAQRQREVLVALPGAHPGAVPALIARLRTATADLTTALS